MNKKIARGKGFTLIELLVVIAIIGLLSTLSVVALNNARGKARNARRVADVKQVQTALELFYNDRNTYPSSVDFDGASSISTGTSPVITYMSIVPSNPIPWVDGSGTSACTDSNYIYTRTSANSYVIHYCLGEDTGGVLAGSHHATPSGINN